MTKMINISNFASNVENKDGVALVDFFATWCEPCKMLSPVYSSLGQEM